MLLNIRTGTMIEIKWNQRSLFNATEERTVHAILISPIHANVGTEQERLSGWKCNIVYDSHPKRKKTPYSTYYEIKWLKMCERQGKLKIISEANANNGKR